MTMLFIFIIMLITALFPGISAPGTRQAVEICLFSVIPSVFPFLVLNYILLKSGEITVFCNRHLKIFGKIFRLPPVAATAVVLGFISGYPTGVKIAGELYEEKLLTYDEYCRLTAFCSNAGPAFITGTAGSALLRSPEYGIFLLIIHLISAICNGLIFAGLKKNPTTCRDGYMPDIKKQSILQLFSEAISDSLKSVSSICGFIIFFGCITSYIRKLPGLSGILLTAFAEMTNGISAIAKLSLSPQVKISLISACIGWGGLCVHFQGFCFLKGKKYYLIGKALQGILSFIISYIAFSVFNKL